MRRALLGTLLLTGLLVPPVAGAASCSTQEGERTASAGTLVLGSSTVACEEGRARWTRHQYGASESTTGASARVADDRFVHATDHFACRSESHGVVVRAAAAEAWVGVEDEACDTAFADARSGQRSRGVAAYANAFGLDRSLSAPFVNQWWDENPQGRQDHAVLFPVHTARDGDACYVWWAPERDVPMEACDATETAVGRAMGVPLVPLHP